MNKRQIKRLLNVARALRESPVPENFTMEQYGYCDSANNCGTPACAFGHYAFRTDLQRKFRLDIHGDPVFVDSCLTAHYDMFTVRAHFGLSYFEAEELFGPKGCAGAQTTKEAAQYIKQFVKQFVKPFVKSKVATK